MRGKDDDNQASLSSSFRLTLSPSPRSPMKSAKSPLRKKRLSIFSRVVDENGEEDESLEFSGLISPRLEKELLKKERRGSLAMPQEIGNALLSPVRSVSNFVRRASVTRLVGSPKADESESDSDDSDDDEEESEEEETEDEAEDGGDDDDDDDLEKNLSQDELMLLLARELQLIDDGEDDDDDDDQ